MKWKDGTIVTTRDICQDINCGVVVQGPMLPRGVILGVEPRAAQEGALHPVMVTANDDDDDASSAAKGSKVG